MSSRKGSFMHALQLQSDLTDEVCTATITDLIARATREKTSPVTLREVYQAIAQYDGTGYLEPLDVLPTLLPCQEEGSTELVHICGMNSNPKEIMIVVQEAIEHLRSILNEEDDDPELRVASLQRIIGVLRLCTAAVPRSRLGRRTPFDLCAPLITDIMSLLLSAAVRATKHEGRVVVYEVAELVRTLFIWACRSASVAEVSKVKTLLRELLDTTVTAYAFSIRASLSARAFESHFSRFIVRSAAEEGWEDGTKAMSNVQEALVALDGYWRADLQKPKSHTDIMYLAHASPPVALSLAVLSDLCPLLLASVQTNVALDESLYLLFRVITQDASLFEDTGIPLDVPISLCNVLSAVASTHLDDFMRQLNLRLVSLILSKLPSAPRLEILLKLTSDEELPQIRGPAIGLVKEAVLEAFALPLGVARSTPFASPLLLRAFGPALFKTNPPDFFAQSWTRETLEHSLELLRIADCLSFYYVLLQRDCRNITGVRDPSNVASVEGSLLRPLRAFLARWSISEEEPLMAILSLQLGLDRIDDALDVIRRFQA
ncbi:hypothetical protein F5I97DRAFT_1931647 [Phlebopus sp. FC_14]|nr:hypothetical protein F5I97DRAFT_1931647 [Phlebopus sp. FC_14]